MKDEELLEVVTEFREGILDGEDSYLMCFVVCSPLQSYLSCMGIKTKMIKRDFNIPMLDCIINHVWLELKDGRIIDPTADQFNQVRHDKMPPVYIGEKLDWYN